MHCLPPSPIVRQKAPTGNAAAAAGHIDLANGFRFALDNDQWDEIIHVVRKGDTFRVCYAGSLTNHGYSMLVQNASDEGSTIMTSGGPRTLPLRDTPQ